MAKIPRVVKHATVNHSVEFINWRELATPQYLSRYVWIDVRGDGVYCLYCRHAVARGSGTSGRYHSKAEARGDKQPRSTCVKEHIFSISFTTTITSIAASQPASSLADASQVISPKTIPPWYLYSPPGHSYCMQPPVQPSMHMLWSTNAVQMQAIYMYSHRLSGQQ